MPAIKRTVSLAHPIKGQRITGLSKVEALKKEAEARKKEAEALNKPIKPEKYKVVTRYYRNSKGQIVEKKKAGRTSQKDPVLRALNAYREAGGEGVITRVYSSKSRIMRGTEGMLAVEILRESPITRKDMPYKGWVYTDKQGKTKIEFEGGGNSILSALAGLDSAAPMRPGEMPLKELYERCSPQAQANLAEVLKDLDWNHIFRDEIYRSDDPDAGADIDNVYVIRDEVRALMMSIIKPIGA